MAKQIPVDAYIRVSRVGDRQGDRFISPELQRESIKRVAEREGLKVVKWFEELDASGGDADRPLWNECINRVEEGKTQGMVCWNLSRFSRSVKDALTAIDRIEDAGGKVYSEEGNLGKLDRAIRLVIAEDERDRARAGFQNAVSNAIHRGIYIAAKIPFGYNRDPESRRLVPDPETAPLVVELFERRAKGHSWAQLSSWASEHGYYFARETVRGMVMNPAYLGHARQGTLINEKAHPAIIGRKLWESAQKAKGRKPVHTGASAHILLRGIVTCATCNHKMVVGNTQGAKINGKREKVSAYYCRNLACQDHAYSKAQDVDEYVTQSLLAFLSSADATLRNKDNDPKELIKAERELEDAELALTQFKANKKAISILGINEWNALLEEYVVARDVAQTNVETLKGEDHEEEFNLVPQLWQEWTTESRREFLQRVISECSLRPSDGGKLPMRDRVEIALNLGGMNAEIRPSKLPEGWEITVFGIPVVE